MNNKSITQNKCKKPTAREHGGSLAIGKRKDARPFDPAKPFHAVFAAKNFGRVELQLILKEENIFDLIKQIAGTYKVDINELAVQDLHLHIVAYTNERKYFNNFLRQVSSRVSMLMTGSRRGRAHESYWVSRPYTRVLEWGQDWRNARTYVKQNTVERYGLYNRYDPAAVAGNVKTVLIERLWRQLANEMPYLDVSGETAQMCFPFW